MSGTWAHLLALVPIAGGVVIAGMVAAVLRAYYRSSRVSGPAGLLPRHVLLIGASYLLFVGAAVWEATHQLDGPWSWRVPVHSAGTVLGVLALVEILRYERRRVHTHHSRTVLVEETRTEIDDNGTSENQEGT